MTFCCFNHQLEPVDLSETWFRQRAFQFGDGHFTTAKVEHGQIVWWDLHLARLQKANLRLRISDIEWQQLTYVCRTMCKPIDSGYIKIQISRGESSRGYQVSSEIQPTVIITANEMPLSELFDINESQSVGVTDTQLGLNPQLAGLKHLNRLEQVLIQCELQQKAQTEGLVTDINGHLIESSKGNVFWFANGDWFTPDLSKAGIDGVFRQWFIEVISQLNGLELSNRTVHICERTMTEIVRDCDAMFICNAITGPVPVKRIVTKVGNESIDKLLDTKRVFELFSQLRQHSLVG